MEVYGETYNFKAKPDCTTYYKGDMISLQPITSVRINSLSKSTWDGIFMNWCIT